MKDIVLQDIVYYDIKLYRNKSRWDILICYRLSLYRYNWWTSFLLILFFFFFFFIWTHLESFVLKIEIKANCISILKDWLYSFKVNSNIKEHSISKDSFYFYSYTSFIRIFKSWMKSKSFVNNASRIIVPLRLKLRSIDRISFLKTKRFHFVLFLRF